MLRGNLSTRPFYNDRLVSATLGIIALVGLALTAYNVTELRALSKTHSDLSGQITANDAEAADIEHRTAQLRGTVDIAGTKVLAANVREANDLIDRRTFSWTTLLSIIEQNIPMDAHLLEVQPKVDKGLMRVAMSVLCKTRDELQPFVDALAKSRAFEDVTVLNVNRNDDDSLTAFVEGTYLAMPLPSATPKKKGGKGTP